MYRKRRPRDIKELERLRPAQELRDKTPQQLLLESSERRARLQAKAAKRNAERSAQVGHWS